MAKRGYDQMTMDELDEAHADWHARKLESETALREEGRKIRSAKEALRAREAVEAMSEGEREALIQRAELAKTMSEAN